MLISLVLVLCVEFVFQLVVQVIQLLVVALLVGLERVVNFFALIDGVLLNVLNLPMELKVGYEFCSHHLVFNVLTGRHL